MAIRIKTNVVDGEQRVPPNCMKLLLDFAGHRHVCDECHDAFKYNRVDEYCITGKMILEELANQPEVEQC